MIRKLFVNIACIFLFFFEFAGQDIHFSQNDAVPLFLSPSNAGESCDFSFYMNHRNQWSSITVPYVTFSAAAEKKIENVSFLGGNDVGLGVIIANDKAGDGELTTTRIDFLGAYKLDFANNVFKHISLGISIAYVRTTIDYTKLYFGSQFNGNYFDPELPQGETFKASAFGFADFALGVNSVLNIYGYKVLTGISLNHITSPKQKFFGDNDTKLDSRLNYFIASPIKLNSSNEIVPSLFLYKQGKLKEIDIGGIWSTTVNSLSVNNIFAGGWWRFGDAIIIKVGLIYNSVTLGLSYDINLSKLRVASAGKGGFEISLIYKICKLPVIPHKRLRHYCPEFM